MSKNELDDQAISLTRRMAHRSGADDSIGHQIRKARVFASLFESPLQPIKLSRYTLLECLGAGGMGKVYAAYDEQLDRKVAVKLVRTSRDSGAETDERLMREAQILARLSHANVVHVYEAGRFGDQVYIAMEFVRGVTSREWLRSLADLPRAARLRAILDHYIAAGRGLEAAHKAGLVHRDFKPDNVLVDDQRPRVVDFGLARDVDQEPAKAELPDSEAPAAPAARCDVNRDSSHGGDRVRSVDPGQATMSALTPAVALTTVGRVMGTPGLHGAGTDAR